MPTIPTEWAKARGTQRFVKRGDVRGRDLRGADLSDIRLEMVEATSADLRETDCADFRALDCKFEGANFVGAALAGARFMDCLLAGADFSDCLMQESMLAACSLGDAKLSGATLRGADLTGSSFDRARLAAADLSYCQAKRASFDGADLHQADLRFGNFEGATFIGAKLSGVAWEGANLVGARFDPGTGARMLAEAAQALPAPGREAYAALECAEGARRWYVIERRESRREVVRVDNIEHRNAQLLVSFERLDDELTLLGCCALIEDRLLRGLLSLEYTDQALTFSELSSKIVLALPG